VAAAFNSTASPPAIQTARPRSGNSEYGTAQMRMSFEMNTKHRSGKPAARNAQAGSQIADGDPTITEASDDLHAYYARALVKLKEIKQVADAQLEQLHETGDETWNDLAQEVDTALTRLRSNLDTLVARFEDDVASSLDTATGTEKKNTDAPGKPTTRRSADEAKRR
jgi:hypothetical protein